MTIKTILDQKPGGVITIEPTSTLQATVKKMCDQKIGALLVQSEGGNPVGIITERDILCFCTSGPGQLDKVNVSDVMTKELVVATLDTRINDAKSIMTEKRFRHLPIVDNGKIIGIVSIGDLVKAMLEETAVEVKYLRDYISS